MTYAVYVRDSNRHKWRLSGNCPDRESARLMIEDYNLTGTQTLYRRFKRSNIPLKLPKTQRTYK